MSRKIETPVTLFAQIEAAQHDKLRALAFQEKRSVADLVREALDDYLERRGVSMPRLVVREERVAGEAPALPRRKAAGR